MEYDVDDKGTPATSKRMRQLDEMGQEAIWASRTRCDVSRAIGTAATLSTEVGDMTEIVSH